MILSQAAIKQRMAKGDIVIDPFDEKQLNPNSYNLRLHSELLVYRKAPRIPAGWVQETDALDMRVGTPATRMAIPRFGMRLLPGILYLGRTVERTETRNLVPQIQGRSSVARLGLSVHVTAGFGDIGFRGHWTLELTVVEPLIVYADAEVCQIIYHVPDLGGEPAPEYKGRYQDAKEIEPSKMHQPLNDASPVAKKRLRSSQLRGRADRFGLNVEWLPRGGYSIETKNGVKVLCAPTLRAVDAYLLGRERAEGIAQ